ncbi:hypothetical protein RclHR1_23800004 [Rhizophagus clarus]|uniref:Uncharacterized protein n=1 Tax=Rhizophagus clarus TaxID=94130 RepID=A0A2Z6RQV2_9GLOM|nr:hypothetical protein RclHR1_23800004 [Rhizophagus clarus]
MNEKLGSFQISKFSFLSFGRAQSLFQTLFRRLEILDVKEQPWTLHFEGSGSQSTAPDFFFVIFSFFWGLEAKDQNSISRQTTLRVQNSFRGGLYDISKVQKSFIGGLLSGTPLGADYDISKSGTPLEADYDILKIQMFHFKDWTLFEDLVTIFEDYFEGPDKARTPFKGQRLDS